MRYIWKLLRKNAQLRKENRALIRALGEERALTRDNGLIVSQYNAERALCKNLMRAHTRAMLDYQKIIDEMKLVARSYRETINEMEREING